MIGKILILTFVLSSNTYEIVAEDLAQAILKSKDGDTILVNGGRFEGSIEINKNLKIIGLNNPVIDGKGKGTIVKITRPVVFKGFIVKNTGSFLEDEDSAIFVSDTSGVVIEENTIEDALFGIYLKNVQSGLIRKNKIKGKKLEISQRGDGIRLWNTRYILIKENFLENVRDAVIWYSENVTFIQNKVLNSRYGLHYMYSNNNMLSGNEFKGNVVGTFIMFSKKIRVENNVFGGAKELSGIGVGFKDASAVVLKNNLIADNTVGIYLANSPEYILEEFFPPESIKEDDIVENKVHGNLIKNNVLAFNTVVFRILPPSFPNYIVQNTFWANIILCEFEQVLEDKNIWYMNYYDDYRGFDSDQDGIGDIPFRYETLFMKVLLDYPEIRFLYFSPIRTLLEYISNVLPFLKPTAVFSDSKPMVSPEFFGWDRMRRSKETWR